MSDKKEIYETQAGQYERLVSYEDYRQNIFPAVNKIHPLAGSDVVELGAGSGRLTAMLAPVANSIRAFDAAQPMLDVAIAKLERTGLQNWSAEVADHRHLPVASQSADLAISGWSVCYTVVCHPHAWRDELAKALAEMKRVLRPGGTVIILETQGTGHQTPHPPPGLVKYYRYLEEEARFSSTWIRTDYQFPSLDEAERLTRFFFGDALAEETVRQNWTILPECTGIWWLDDLRF